MIEPLLLVVVSKRWRANIFFFFYFVSLSLFLSQFEYRSIIEVALSLPPSLSLSFLSSRFFPPPFPHSPPFSARRSPSTLRTTLTLRRKSDVNGIKSFERAYARVGWCNRARREYEQGCGGGALVEYGNWNCTLAEARERAAWPRERKRDNV